MAVRSSPTPTPAPRSTPSSLSVAADPFHAPPLQYLYASRQGTSHRVSFPRASHHHRGLHPRRPDTLQLCHQSHHRRVPRVRPRSPLARHPLCRIPDASALLPSRTGQRHAQLPAARRQRSLRHLLGQTHRNTFFLLLTETLMLPFFAAFYNIPVLPQVHYLLLVLFLGSLGVSIVGTALSAISAQARMRELLLPLLLLPLLTPVLVVSATVSVSLLDREPVVQWKGVGFLAIFDFIFLTALWLFGEYLLEE